MPGPPLARLDTYLPARLADGGAGFVQHLAADAVDLDVARPLPPGRPLSFDLVCRDDLVVALSGTPGPGEPLPSGLQRHRVGLDRTEPAAREALAALLSGRRKASHLALCRDEDVESRRVRTGFDRYRLPHVALPELHADEVDTSVHLLGRRLRAPLLISGMTGGSLRAGEVNRRLAEVAQRAGIGLGLGSQRVMIESPELAATFRVRDVAPDVLLLANVGAVQLNYGLTAAAVRDVVHAVGADAVCLHLNPLQEAVQPEGDRDFRGLAAKIAEVVHLVGVPVVLKETGAGISGEVATLARDLGVAALDVGGAGGTSWGYIEGLRAADPEGRAVGETFRDWGIPTAEALHGCARAVPGLPLIATGGIRDGLDVARALALGATACGLALPFLRAVEDSVEAGVRLAERLAREVRIALFCSGARDVAALKRLRLARVEEDPYR